MEDKVQYSLKTVLLQKRCRCKGLPRARKGPQTQSYRYPLQKLAVKDQ